MSNNIIIETRNLKKYFKTRAGYLHAVDDVNLTISSGKTLGVVGESGCGKSTLGRTILQLLEPTSGEVLFQGQDISKYKGAELRQIRKDMQIIFQDPYASLNPRMSVFEIISEYMMINKVYKTKEELWNQTAHLMDIVGLSRRLAGSYPHELDGGRRQRIGVARAISLKPKFIVCDEPVSALDVSIQAQILNLLMDIQDEMKISYLFITHDLSVVKHISDEIAVMYLGQVIEQADSNTLFKSPKHPYTKALLEAVPVPESSAREKTIATIKGEVSDPIEPPEGCRFASRCEFAFDKCHNITPPFLEVGEKHRCACHLYDI